MNLNAIQLLSELSLISNDIDIIEDKTIDTFKSKVYIQTKNDKIKLNNPTIKATIQKDKLFLNDYCIEMDGESLDDDILNCDSFNVTLNEFTVIIDRLIIQPKNPKSIVYKKKIVKKSKGSFQRKPITSNDIIQIAGKHVIKSNKIIPEILINVDTTSFSVGEIDGKIKQLNQSLQHQRALVGKKIKSLQHLDKTINKIEAILFNQIDRYNKTHPVKLGYDIKSKKILGFTKYIHFNGVTVNYIKLQQATQKRDSLHNDIKESKKYIIMDENELDNMHQQKGN
jgi:hypothetical protein